MTAPNYYQEEMSSTHAVMAWRVQAIHDVVDRSCNSHE